MVPKSDYQICVLRDLRNTICSDSGTVRGDCVKGNLSKRHTDTQTKQMNETSDPLEDLTEINLCAKSEDCS